MDTALWESRLIQKVSTLPQDFVAQDSEPLVLQSLIPQMNLTPLGRLKLILDQSSFQLPPL